MRLISALLLFQFTAVAAGHLGSGWANSNGVTISYETRLEPPTPPISKFCSGTLTENNVIKRHLCDFAQKRYFGYDLTMEAVGDGGFRLAFSPLTITPQKMEEIFRDTKGWTQLPLPQNPVTQILRSGETLALDLFVNPSTGQKIVEYIKIQSGEGRTLTASGPPRDFSAEDGWIEISAPRLKINGTPVPATTDYRGGVGGSPVWIYLSGRGRFVFSLAPRLDLGFQKAGEIRGSTMTWRWGSDEFSMNTNRRIAPGEGVYTVYVFNDPRYRPQGDDTAAGFLLGAGGTIESLVRH
jgi:hypothetical protein